MPEGGDEPCPLYWSHENESTEDFGTFEFEDSDHFILVNGVKNTYVGDEGFKEELDILDFEAWINKVERLKSGNFINIGTRLIEVTMNAVNPQIAVTSVIKLRFEFDSIGNIAPSYQIYSFGNEPFDEYSITLYVIIQIMMIL